MSRQNRVTPFGEIIATPARGTLMGNRGCLHDNHGRIRRPYQTKRWIICLLNFKQRHRTVMTPGQYTELFFLDEATALAAGHRPCAECQRERFNFFRECWAAANPTLTAMAKPPASMIDAVLHGERLRKEREVVAIDQLPDGSFVTFGDERNAYLVLQGRLLHWSPFGYGQIYGSISVQQAQLLTPASTVRALAAGYVAALHPSITRVTTNPDL